MAGKFNYFAYGSNLLKERIRLSNPSAVFETVGKLQGYKLDFSGPDNTRWHGAVATITEAIGQTLWGVIWQMDKFDIPSLDLQESGYDPVEVDVMPQGGGETQQCRTYIAKVKPGDGNRPSPQYMDVVIRGAMQSKLPDEYINELKSIEHNNYKGNVAITAKLGDGNGMTAKQ